MKQANLCTEPRTSYTYRFADGTTSTVRVGDTDENGCVVTEEMVELLYERDEVPCDEIRPEESEEADFCNDTFADGTISAFRTSAGDENDEAEHEEMNALLSRMEDEKHEHSDSASPAPDKDYPRVVKGVYDTLTGQYVDVPVSEAVYSEYMRGKWSIEDQNNKFYAHEIQMSQLAGGDDDSFGNFDEFISSESDPYEVMRHESLLRILREELDKMDYWNRDLIESIYFGNMSEREYAKKNGFPQKTVNNRKRAILRRIKEKMKNF